MNELKPDNPDRGTSFEGEMRTDMRWVRESLRTLLERCEICGRRVAVCEEHVHKAAEPLDRIAKNEASIRALETDMTRVKAVGGILGTLGGLLSGIAFKLWGGHS